MVTIFAKMAKIPIIHVRIFNETPSRISVEHLSLHSSDKSMHSNTRHIPVLWV